MSELFFVLKTLVLSAAIIALMQVKVGSDTLEQQSLQWLRKSNAVHALRGVAQGGVLAIEEGYRWARSVFDRTVGGAASSAIPKRSDVWKDETERTGDEVD